MIVDPEVSYAQGMNDLCSRFLEVLDSEVDTYWSFSCYMEKFSKDFRADGLHRKIGEITENKCNLMYNKRYVSKIYVYVVKSNLFPIILAKNISGPLLVKQGY